MKTYNPISKKNSCCYNIKKTILVVILSCTTSLGIAQAGFGASASFNMFSKGQGQFVSFGPLTEFGIAKGKYSARISFNYFLPKTSKDTTQGIEIGNTANAQQISVNYTDKYSIMSFIIDAKRYLGKDAKFMDGGFYAGLGVGILVENVKTNYSPFDSQKYYVRTSATSVTYDQIMVRGFGGYEVVFGSGSLFCEAQLMIPANSSNADGTVIEVPISIAIQCGYKYLIR